MKPLDLSRTAAALDHHFGNRENEVRVAFVLVATPFAKDEVGETSVISNITDTAALVRIIGELQQALRLKECRPEGQA